MRIRSACMDRYESGGHTERHRRGGRVAIGHVTNRSALPPARLAEVAHRLAGAGVAVTVLPATDLFLMGRGHDHNIPRGVTHAHTLLQHGVTCSLRSEEHTSELQSLMRISYAVFCLTKKKQTNKDNQIISNIQQS